MKEIHPGFIVWVPRDDEGIVFACACVDTEEEVLDVIAQNASCKIDDFVITRQVGFKLVVE